MPIPKDMVCITLKGGKVGCFVPDAKWQRRGPLAKGRKTTPAQSVSGAVQQTGLLDKEKKPVISDAEFEAGKQAIASAIDLIPEELRPSVPVSIATPGVTSDYIMRKFEQAEGVSCGVTIKGATTNIYLNKGCPKVANAIKGDPSAIREISETLVHEEAHVRGGDEKAARKAAYDYRLGKGKKDKGKKGAR